MNQVSSMNGRLTWIVQAYTQSNSLFDERVHSSGASRCCSSRALVEGDPRLDTTPSSSVVPEQVGFSTVSRETHGSFSDNLLLATGERSLSV